MADDKKQKETTERDRNQANVPNPYEILLSTSGGQYVEVSNLASYLGKPSFDSNVPDFLYSRADFLPKGTGVHIASAVSIKDNNNKVGDGFSDNSENFDALRAYVTTLPALCLSLGNTMVKSVGDPSTISCVETMM